MMHTRFFLAVLVAVALLATAAPRDARAGEDWVIDNFTSAIAIQRDGSLLITENIDVDFGALQKHGIFRDIPVEYSIPGDDKHNRIYGFETVSVTDASGNAWTYTQSRNGDDVELKIGDAGRLISGKQSYRIIAPGADGRPAGRARRHEGRDCDDRRPRRARLRDD